LEKKIGTVSRKKLLLIGFGYFAVAVFGTLLIAPCGPGSDRIRYIVLLIYSLLIAFLYTGFTRALGVVLAIVFICGVISETIAKNRFQHHITEQIQKRLE
jgi:hypothetical protein